MPFGPTDIHPRNQFNASYCLDAGKQWEIAKAEAAAQGHPEVFCSPWNRDMAPGSVSSAV